MRKLGAWAVLVFVAALAYVIGVRLSETAMAVVIGVIFGVLASVPASLLLIWHITRTTTAGEMPRGVYPVREGYGEPSLPERLDGTGVRVLPGVEVRR